MPKNLQKSSKYHEAVLLTEAVDWLNVKAGGRYVDATIGGGSHTQLILARGGVVLGLDQDLEAVSACLAQYPNQVLDRSLILVQSNFTHLKTVVTQQNFSPVSGVLFDLGMSQHQVATASRGFSLQRSGPLDMRMGDTAITAAELINNLPEDKLSQILTDFGEVPTARLLAAKIISHRPLATTDQLAAICGKWSRQVFQAIRIAVNDELGALQFALPQALEVLESGGRLVVISFHSLEDRIVKKQFADWQKQSQVHILTSKPINGERKSKLRAVEKI